MSGDEDLDGRGSQHFSNIHVEGNSHVHIGNYYQPEDFHTVLDRLSRADQAARLEQLLDRRLDGSADWFLTDYVYCQWRDEGNRVLWCDGVPGAGKTFIMASVIADIGILHASDDDVAVAYFLCNFQGRGEQSTSQILSSMARQLVEQKRSLLHHVKKYLDEGTSKRLPGVKFKEEDRVRSLVVDLCKGFTKVYLVLDGLDEFSAKLEQRTRLLTALSCLPTILLNDTILRLCISSRIDQEAQDALGSHLAVNIRPDSGSIRNFIIDRLEQSTTLKRIARTSELYHEIIDSVATRSDRIFMLAALQMQYLGTLTSTLKIKAALPRLSKRFEDYYKQSLDRIREKPQLQGQIFHLFLWLLYASRPLNVDQLRQCLCIEPDIDLDTPLEDLDEHVERLAAESEGLVEIGSSLHRHDTCDNAGEHSDPETRRYVGSVKLAHETIATYLRSQCGKWSPVSQSPDEFVFSRCARFLSLSASAARLVDHAVDCIERRCRVELLEPGFLAWCAKGWRGHIPGRRDDDAELEVFLRTLARQLLHAAEARLMDPLFLCDVYKWPSLRPILIKFGANEAVRYDGLSHDIVNWAFRSHAGRMRGVSYLGSADMFEGYHENSANIAIR